MSEKTKINPTFDNKSQECVCLMTNQITLLQFYMKYTGIDVLTENLLSKKNENGSETTYAITMAIKNVDCCLEKVRFLYKFKTHSAF